MHYDLSAYSWNETEVANYLQYLATYFRPKSILEAEDILHNFQNWIFKWDIASESKVAEN